MKMMEHDGKWTIYLKMYIVPLLKMEIYGYMIYSMEKSTITGNINFQNLVDFPCAILVDRRVINRFGSAMFFGSKDLFLK